MKKIKALYSKPNLAKLSSLQVHLLTLICLSLVPSSRAGFSSLTTWGDQSAILETLKTYTEIKNAPLVSNNWLGPGVIFLSKIFYKISGSFEVALILMSVLSISFVFGFLFQTVRASAIEYKIKYSMLILFSYFALHINLIREIPWTHLWVCALIFIQVSIFNTKNINSIQKPILLGLLGFVTFEIRNFEMIAALLAFIIINLLALRLNIPQKNIKYKKVILSYANYLMGAIIGWISVGIATGRWMIFRQYSGSIPEADFSIYRLVNRIIQTFLNPTWHAIPTPNLFVWNSLRTNIFTTDISAIWFQPIIRSQPMLLPLIFIALLTLTVNTITIAKKSQNVNMNYYLGTFLVFFAIIIIAGYMLQPIVGSTSLKYGFLRELLLPQLALIAGIVFLNVKNSKVTRQNYLSKFTAEILIFLTFIVLILPKPADNSYQDYKIQIENNCIKQKRCDFTSYVKTNNQWKLMENQPIEVRQKCNSNTLSKKWETRFEFTKASCRGSLYVYALPLSFGIATTPESDRIFENNWLLVSE